MLSISIGLVALLIAFDEVIKVGWGDPRIIGLILVFAVLIGAFAFIERAAGGHALVPSDVMRNRDFAYSCAAIRPGPTVMHSEPIVTSGFGPKRS